MNRLCGLISRVDFSYFAINRLPFVLAVPIVSAKYLYERRVRQSETGTGFSPNTQLKWPFSLSLRSALGLTSQEIVNQTKDSVVGIFAAATYNDKTNRYRLTDQLCTGFIIGGNNLVITNTEHLKDIQLLLIDDLTNIMNSYPTEDALMNATQKGRLIYKEPGINLALIQLLDRRHNWRALQWSDEQLEESSQVFSYGLSNCNMGLTPGLVITCKRSPTELSGGTERYYRSEIDAQKCFINHTAAIHGNTRFPGGPLLDSNGRVVGVNFSCNCCPYDAAIHLAVFAKDAKEFLNRGLVFDQKYHETRNSFQHKRKALGLDVHLYPYDIVDNGQQKTVHGFQVYHINPKVDQTGDQTIVRGDCILQVNGVNLRSIYQLTDAIKNVKDNQRIDLTMQSVNTHAVYHASIKPQNFSDFYVF